MIARGDSTLAALSELSTLRADGQQLFLAQGGALVLLELLDTDEPQVHSFGALVLLKLLDTDEPQVLSLGWVKVAPTGFAVRFTCNMHLMQTESCRTKSCIGSYAISHLALKCSLVLSSPLPPSELIVCKRLR